MRISDWSSDVCSSDLHAVDHASALDRRARRELVGPALDILVIVDLQELARVIDESLGERAIPGPDRHVGDRIVAARDILMLRQLAVEHVELALHLDRKSTRLNSSH